MIYRTCSHKEAHPGNFISEITNRTLKKGGELVWDNYYSTLTTNPTPSEHVHNWSSTWSSDASYHWHNCSTNDCPITDSSQKNGYALHAYGNWVTDVVANAYQNGSQHWDCTICGYRQTETIPATGGSSGGSTDRPGGSSSNSSNSNSSTNKTPTTTATGTKQPTTTTVVDQLTGIKTETTFNPDDSTIEVTTQKNGTTTTVTTDSTSKVRTSSKTSCSIPPASGLS